MITLAVVHLGCMQLIMVERRACRLVTESAGLPHLSVVLYRQYSTRMVC
jgi:hypothetical protein